MTSDLIQNQYIAKAHSKKGAAIANSQDFFKFLKKETRAKEEKGKTTDIYALLKSAHNMLEKAEKDLEQKNTRIQNLEQLLTIDELTGLTNRRGFYQNFIRELERTNRGENIGGLLIMIDLDKFKAINDTYGHQAGDETLKVVASFMKQSMRNTDIAARLGGDEFIILMPNTSTAKALERARKIENQLNRLSLNFEGNSIKIEGSLGLREYKKGDSLETIIGDADEHMYEQKAQRKEAVNH